ncbi:MGDG synthase family glycosyltransferase [Scopulibacillus daqui]|uniref:MGDG synthase family glycosyltransferase n=1 Tax=Scopulibacillus daqui TaxID=1469162 RepID=UPI003627C645
MSNSEKSEILILAGHYGEGHKQAALAIKEAFNHKYTDIHVTIIDPAKEVHPILESISRNLFLRGVKVFPSIYNYIYEKTRYPNDSRTLLKGINRLGIDHVFEIISDIQPEIIVCTCPIAAGMIATLKEYGLIDIPTVTVITDHTVHSYWIYKTTDIYLVGSAVVSQGLQKLGIDKERIKVTGIPINPKFSNHFNQQALKKKHQLDENLPTVLISGGGYGIIKDIIPALKLMERMPFKIQFIITCGHNHRLYQRMKQQLESSKHHLVITGYVDYIEELMAVSDFMVSKAGGLTVSEAIAMNLPLLLYKSIGGQEQDNTNFLIDRKAALLAKDEHDLYAKMIQLLTHPELISMIQRNIQDLKQQRNAASLAVQVILKAMSHKSALRIRQLFSFESI